MKSQSSLFRYRPDTSNVVVPKHVTHLIIDASVQIIDKEAFSRKRKLVQVNFDNNSNLQIIGYDAFSHCRLLQHLELPPTLCEIRDDAFGNAKSLVLVHLPHGLRWMGERTFADCTSLRHIQIPSTVEELGFRLFLNCRNLVSVELMEGLLAIGEKAMEHCISLRNVTIPSTVQVVEPNAFLNCWKLEQRFPYTTELHHALRHRFDDLPMHRMCHLHSFPHRAILEYNDMELCTGDQVDCFGMTVLHILALSTTPNLSVWKDLLYKLPNPSQLAQTKDRWNQSSYDYLLVHLESRSEMPAASTSDWQSMMEHVIEVTLLHPTQSLGLESWRRDIWNRVDLFQTTASITEARTNALTADQIHDAYDKLSEYMKLEVYSLLELSIWKAKIDEQGRNNGGMHRQSCRIHCGVQVILPNVRSFLKEYNWLQ